MGDRPQVVRLELDASGDEPDRRRQSQVEQHLEGQRQELRLAMSGTVAASVSGSAASSTESW